MLHTKRLSTLYNIHCDDCLSSRSPSTKSLNLAALFISTPQCVYVCCASRLGFCNERNGKGGNGNKNLFSTTKTFSANSLRDKDEGVKVWGNGLGWQNQLIWCEYENGHHHACGFKMDALFGPFDCIVMTILQSDNSQSNTLARSIVEKEKLKNNYKVHGEHAPSVWSAPKNCTLAASLKILNGRYECASHCLKALWLRRSFRWIVVFPATGSVWPPCHVPINTENASH